MQVVVGASAERGSSLTRSQQHSTHASSSSSSSSHVGTAAGPVGSFNSSSGSGSGNFHATNGDEYPALTASAVASGDDRAATLELLWRFFLGANVATLCSNDGTADKISRHHLAVTTAGSDATPPKTPPKSGSSGGGSGGVSFVKEEYVVQDGDTVILS